jgi:hypothetical protein
MALSATKFIQPLANDRTDVGKIVVVEFTLDASYPNGGYAIDPHSLGLSEVWFCSIQQVGPTGPDQNSQIFEWDNTNSKIIVKGGGVAGADNAGGIIEEVATGNSYATTVIRAFFYGLGS